MGWILYEPCRSLKRLALPVCLVEMSINTNAKAYEVLRMDPPCLVAVVPVVALARPQSWGESCYAVTRLGWGRSKHVLHAQGWSGVWAWGTGARVKGQELGRAGRGAEVAEGNRGTAAVAPAPTLGPGQSQSRSCSTYLSPPLPSKMKRE